ncbi:unnamed protein product, partial [Clonostachys chloroleuca]
IATSPSSSKVACLPPYAACVNVVSNAKCAAPFAQIRENIGVTSKSSITGLATVGAAQEPFLQPMVSMTTKYPSTTTAESATGLSQLSNRSRRSVRHRGKQASCPFCDRRYTYAAAVADHLESGRCPRAPGLNRDETYRFVRDKDPYGVITKKLIGWKGTVHYEVGDTCWNGHAYQCNLCRHEFNSLYALSQHVNSPRHQQVLYHCPNHRCRRPFTTIAALFNHLESECCQYATFDHVQNQVGDFFLSNRILRH